MLYLVYYTDAVFSLLYSITTRRNGKIPISSSRNTFNENSVQAVPL